MSSSINSLHLINFRNHHNFQLSSSARLLILEGQNGVGKTSVLEAISLYSPGRGIRNAKPDEILRNEPGTCISNTNPAKNIHEWCVFGRYNSRENTLNISTGCNFSKNSKRIVKIDDKIVSKQSELLELIRIVWLTPQMERIILEAPNMRRKFWDRICYNLYPEHATNFIAYEYYIKSRMKILYMQKFDDVWLKNIESEIADYAIRIRSTRLKCLEIFRSSLHDIGFIRHLNPSIELTEFLDKELVDSYDDEKKVYVSEKLKYYRDIDRKSNRSNFGPHKTDLIILSNINNLNIKYCSTGEQKLMLAAMTLAHAKSIYKISKISPLILLDEVLAHLDNKKQEILLLELLGINSQIFVTTTETDLAIHTNNFVDTDRILLR
ncbi:MAG: DNA replication/repair protein RecF [Candidatus Lariskella arthropodorum]